MDRYVGSTALCLLICCCVVSAIYVDELPGELKKKMDTAEFRDYFPENVIKVSSWNVKSIPTRTICNFIRKTKPLIFGLQDIKRQRIGKIVGDEAIQECDAIKDLYKVFAGSPNTNEAASARYNPIFYRDDRRLKLARGSQMTSINGGTFWLSDNPAESSTNLQDTAYRNPTTPRTCTWLKFRFAEQQRVTFLRRRPFRAKILQILRNNIRKPGEPAGGKPRDRVTRAIRRRRVYYKWSYFYVVNTRLEDEETGVTKSQMRILYDYFRNIVTNRQRFPVVFMGDLGITRQSETYEMLKKQGWFDDDAGDDDAGEDESSQAQGNALQTPNTNYILRTSKIINLFADTLFEGGWPEKTKRPSFSAFLTISSPKRAKVRESNV